MIPRANLTKNVLFISSIAIGQRNPEFSLPNPAMPAPAAFGLSGFQQDLGLIDSRTHGMQEAMAMPFHCSEWSIDRWKIYLFHGYRGQVQVQIE